MHKSGDVFEVLGTLDEFNSYLGVATAFIPESNNKKLLRNIQNDIFLIGDSFAGKIVSTKTISHLEGRLQDIERNIDKLDKVNRQLKNFILPGGSKASAFLHVGRSTCRRLERVVCNYTKKQKQKNINVIIKYLNRLSDYLFVLARYYNNKGSEDVIWKKNL